MAARAPRAPKSAVVPVAAPSRRAKIAAAAEPATKSKRVIPEGATDEQKRLFRNAVITAKRHGSTIEEANAAALAEVFGVKSATKAPKAPKSAKVPAAPAPVAPAAKVARRPRAAPAPAAPVEAKPRSRRAAASAAHGANWVLTIIEDSGVRTLSGPSFEALAAQLKP